MDLELRPSAVWQHEILGKTNFEQERMKLERLVAIWESKNISWGLVIMVCLVGWLISRGKVSKLLITSFEKCPLFRLSLCTIIYYSNLLSLDSLTIYTNLWRFRVPHPIDPVNLITIFFQKPIHFHNFLWESLLSTILQQGRQMINTIRTYT